MTIALRDVLAASPFPLYAIAPNAWEGSVFVGDVVRGTVDGASRPRQVVITYLDALDGTTMGACVSNLDGAIAARGSADEHLAAHLVSFISRFDAGHFAGRVRRRKASLLSQEEFSQRSVTLAFAGATTGALTLTHRSLPLQVVRLATRVKDAVTDVAIAGWRVGALEMAGRVLRVDAAMAGAIDAAQSDPA